jgi:hypothetical protein
MFPIVKKQPRFKFKITHNKNGIVKKDNDILKKDINDLKSKINNINSQLPTFSLQKNCIGSLLKASSNDNSDDLNMNNVKILGYLMLGSINVKTVLENLTQRIGDLENKINTYLL